MGGRVRGSALEGDDPVPLPVFDADVIRPERDVRVGVAQLGPDLSERFLSVPRCELTWRASFCSDVKNPVDPGERAAEIKQHSTGSSCHRGQHLLEDEAAGLLREVQPLELAVRNFDPQQGRALFSCLSASVGAEDCEVLRLHARVGEEWRPHREAFEELLRVPPSAIFWDCHRLTPSLREAQSTAGEAPCLQAGVPLDEFGISDIAQAALLCPNQDHPAAGEGHRVELDDGSVPRIGGLHAQVLVEHEELRTLGQRFDGEPSLDLDGGAGPTHERSWGSGT